VVEAQDLALAQAVQRGEPQAWNLLLRKYQDRLFAVCVRMVRDRDVAADLTQESMVKIIEGLESYDGRAKLSTWMIRITMNVCLTRLRSEKLRRHASLDLADARTGMTASEQLQDGAGFGRVTSELDAESRVEANEQRELLSAALVRLDPEPRAILVLRDARGLDYDQIAEVLSVPVGTVKSRLFRARVALREMIEALERGESPPTRDD
jgi:RNA polymerase sigma-70 factor, ECF subfamily